jgi:hypothetical protein
LRTLAFKTKRFKNGESVKRNRHFQWKHIIQLKA